MLDEVEEVGGEGFEEVLTVRGDRCLQARNVVYLVRQAQLAQLLGLLPSLPTAERKGVSTAANRLKQDVEISVRQAVPVELAITEDEGGPFVMSALPARQIEPTVGGTPTRVRLTRVSGALNLVHAKRRADLFRFRTCCADPRASK
jgi:hypothetical protein